MKWPSDTMIVTKVDIVGMPVPLTQKRRFRALAGLVARQKIPLNLTEIKELSNDEKWKLFDKHLQKHLKFQEDVKLRTMCGSRTGGWSLPCVMSD
jgi:hypothetical protein